MANVIKKANIPASILSELDWDSGGYLIRYRIVSESKNIRSHWSPTYLLPVSSFPDVEGQYSESFSDSDPSKTIVTVTWDDLFNRPSYDVFVAFIGNEPEDSFEYDGDLFHYHGTTPTHTYSFVQRDDVAALRIIVQPASNKKLIKDDFIIYDSDFPIDNQS